MKFTTLLACVALAASGLMSAAQATTYTNVAGVAYEGGGPGIGPAQPVTPGQNFGDFGSDDPADTVIEVSGDLTLYGSVRHRNSTDYADAFSIDFGTGSYDVTFNWSAVNGDADFEFIVDNNFPISLSGSGSLPAGIPLTGLYTFVIDPRAGSLPAVEDLRWNLEIIEIAPVPLPAGALLLLGGLGGLAAMRRRSRA